MECKILHNNQPYLKQLAKNVEEALAKSTNEGHSSTASVTIQWGRIIKNSNAGDYICNSSEGIENVTNRLRMFRILKINGIETPAIEKAATQKFKKASYEIQQLRTIRNYRVFVFQFSTLIMYRSNDNFVWLSNNMPKMNLKYYEVPESENRETKKVARLAEKAIYALGLDFGSVWIGVTSNKSRVVLNVDYTPKLNIRREKLYRDAIVRFAEQYDKDMQTTSPMMGADMEFMFKDRAGKMVLASKYFAKKGSIGCDARTINRDLSKRPLVEIRPDPSNDPEVVVDNIRSIIHNAADKVGVRNLEWLAGSMPFKGYSIGGHVHFSNVKLNTPVTKALDNYLAVPLVLIENPVTAKQRRLKYGFLGDVRTQFHGGYEYRTLGSWVLSPSLTKAVLYLSQFIVKHYTKLKSDVFHSYTNQRSFYTIDRNFLKNYFNQIWAELEQIPGFFSIQKHVNIIPEMINSDQIWEENSDFKENWGVKVLKRAKSG